MIKEVPCLNCHGQGTIAKFNENSAWSERCPNCCGTGVIEVSMTNADRIRAMSDEELAERIAGITVEVFYLTANVLFPFYTDEEKKLMVDQLKELVLKDLQEPAEEDT